MKHRAIAVQGMSGAAAVALGMGAQAQTCDGVAFGGPPSWRVDGRQVVVFDADLGGPRPPELFVAPGPLVWRGEGWEVVRPVVGGPFVSLGVMTIFDEDGEGGNPPALFVGGSWGGNTLVMRFDGNTWANISPTPPISGSVTAMCGHDPDGPGVQPPRLVMAYSTSNGRLAERTATGWTDFGVTASGQFGAGVIKKLLSFDVDGAGPVVPWLVIGGSFQQIGTLATPNIARRVGTTLQRMDAGLAAAAEGVLAMTTLDLDGAGPLPARLFVAGDLHPFNRVVRWGSNAWLTLTLETLDGTASSLLPIPGVEGGTPPTLLVGGSLIIPPNTFEPREMLRWNAVDGFSVEYDRAQPNSAVYDLTMFDLDGEGPRPMELILGENDRVSVLPAGMSAAQSLVPVSLDWADASIPLDPDGAGPLPERLVVTGNSNQVGSWVFAETDGSTWGSLIPGSFARPWAVVDDGTGGADSRRLYGAFQSNPAADPPQSGVSRWTGAGWLAVPGIATAYDVCSHDPDGVGPLPARLLAMEETHRSVSPSQTVGRVRLVEFDGAAWTPRSDESQLFRLGGGMFAVFSLDADPADPVAPQLLAMADDTLFRIVNGGWVTVPSSSIGEAMTTFDADGPGGTPAELWFAVQRFTPGAWYGRYDGQVVTEAKLPIAGQDSSRVRSLCVLDGDGPGPEPARLHALVVGSPSSICRLDGDNWNKLTFTNLSIRTPFTLGGRSPEPLASFRLPGTDRRVLAVCGVSTPSVGIARGPLVLVDPATLPHVRVSPAARSVGRGRTLRLSLTASPSWPSGSGIVWSRDGVALTDGGRVSGAGARDLTIAQVVASDAGAYSAKLTLACGSIETAQATVTVGCPADMDGTGTVTVNDLFAFLAAYFSQQIEADFNESGVLGTQDLFDFLREFFTPCAG